jgi:endonuclease-3
MRGYAFYRFAVPSRRTRRVVDNKRMPHVLGSLQAIYDRGTAPIVTFIAVTTKDPYRVLASCILSLRTQDATTTAASERLFAIAPDVYALARAREDRIRDAIYPVGFYRTKAPRLIAMARRIVSDYAGRVPDDIDTLLTFDGIGRKTANLVVTAGYGKPGICVDTHVHRISNRWGYVRTKTPDQTEAALRLVLPRRYWLRYNDLLVAFGQTVCRPIGPHCDACPIEAWCPSSRLPATGERGSGETRREQRRRRAPVTGRGRQRVTAR